MKIPSYEEILLTVRMNADYIISDLRTKGVGEIPIVINATKLNSKEFETILEEIEKAIRRLKISTQFPYPIYLITKEILSHPHFSIFETLGDLPKHFKVKKKRVTNRENPLINKIAILTKKIGNNPIDKRKETIREITARQRDLNHNSRVLHFYQQINRGLTAQNLKGISKYGRE